MKLLSFIQIHTILLSLAVLALVIIHWAKSRGGIFGSPFERAQIFHLKNRGTSEKQNFNNFNKAVELYQEQIQKLINSNNPNKAKKAMLELGNIYREGMPDSYNRKGKKIRGVPRDLNRAVYWFNQAYQYGSIEALLSVADIYHYDFIEDLAFEGSREKARNLYLYLIEMDGISSYIKAIAKDRIDQMAEDEGLIIHPLDQFAFQPGTYNNSQANGTRQKKQEQRAVEPVRRFAAFEIEAALPQIDNNAGTGNVVGNAIRNDPQNAHDHVVVNSIKESVKRLRNTTDMQIPQPTAFKQVRDLILTNKQEDKRKDAIKALDRIERSEGILSGTNESESDVLHLVWNRIHNDINRDQTDNLKENLVQELAESVEHGAVVCSRGRFNRIVDTLNHVDPDVSIKPQWVLQQEMLSKAANIRSDLEKGLSKKEMDAINELEPNADQAKVANRFKTNLTDKIKKQFHSDYVQSGLMNQKILDAEVDRWIEHI